MDKKWEIGMEIKSLEDFKEFAKGVTSEEFERDYLKYDKYANDYGFRLNGECFDCPNSVGLSMIIKCEEYKSCKKCWTDSVNTIYFKDDIDNSRLVKEENEVAEDTYNNIKDYNKEYTLYEIFEFPNNTEFITCDNRFKLRVNNIDILETMDTKCNNEWYQCTICREWMKGLYKLIPMEKEVSFMELLDNDCKCRVEYYSNIGNYKSEYGSFGYVLEDLGNNHDTKFIKSVIKNGRWFIGGGDK